MSDVLDNVVIRIGPAGNISSSRFTEEQIAKVSEHLLNGDIIYMLMRWEPV